MKINNKKKMTLVTLLVLTIVTLIIIWSGKTPPSYRHQAVLEIIKHNIFNDDNVIQKDLDLMSLPFFKDRIFPCNKTDKPSGKKDIIIFNADFKKSDTNFVALVKTSDLKSCCCGMLLLDSKGKISRASNWEILVSNKPNLCYFFFPKD